MGAEGGSIPSRGWRALIGGAFRLYRDNFRLFFTLFLMPALMFLPINLVLPPRGARLDMGTLVLLTALMIPGLVLLLSFAAAVPAALARVSLGQKPGPFECYRQAFPKIVPLFFTGLIEAVILLVLAIPVIIAVLTGLAILVIVAVLIIVPLLIFILISLFFVNQVIVIEGKYYVSALRRSYDIVQGSWWRVLGLVLLFGLIGLMLYIPVWLLSAAASSLSRELGFVVSAVGGALVQPPFAIVAILLYFDLRVRKEGYTLEALAREMGLPPADPSQSPPRVA